jgi:hypothetical protein
LLKFQDFRGSVERSTGSLGHLNIHVPGKSKIGYLELLVLIQQQIVRFEITMQFVYLDRDVLSLLM